MRVGAVLTAGLALGALAHGESISVVTEDVPPYTIVADERVGGLSTEVVQAVCREAGVTCHIRVYPWARAYATAQHDRNVLIYSILRTPERERLFKWVGEIASRRAFLFRRRDRTDIRLGGLDDAKRYAVGAVNGDARADYLKQQGFAAIQLAPDDFINLRKLQAGRIDLLLANELVFVHVARSLGIDPAGFDKALFLEQFSHADFSMAFGADSDDALVERFRAALGRVKASGEHERILRAYSMAPP